MIPKILLQTSKKKLSQYILDNINSHIDSDWQYMHFTDAEILEFFKNNPIDELPDIANVFNNLPCGEYKADLFRYYFLYLKGGVFVDSDLELNHDLNFYISNYNYFTVQASAENENCYFQGLLGVAPKNKIIFESLLDTYNFFRNNQQTSFYTELCYRFRQISLKHEFEYKVKILDEIIYDGYAIIIDNHSNQIIATHFQTSGIIPPPVDKEKNTSRKQLIRAAYLNYLNREPDESGLQNYLNSNLTIHGVVIALSNSNEYKELHKL